MGRKEEQAELLVALGAFLGPMLRIINNPADFDGAEQQSTLARLHHDRKQFLGLINTFVSGQAGHDYDSQRNRIRHAVNTISSISLTRAISSPEFAQAITDANRIVRESLLSIPVPVDSAIHAAHTPFATMRLLASVCKTAAQEIVWLDRYFDWTIFHRYLAELQPATIVTLVTWPRSKAQGKVDQSRIDRFLDVSKLYAKERGNTLYRLIENDSFHDRWLKCDDKMLSLGGSIKDLGNDSVFTITVMDDTPVNHQHFQVATSGTELFGPNCPDHPA